MERVTVHLHKPGKNAVVTYEGEVVLREPGHLLIHARWERSRLELGFVTFETGDHFFEHYYLKEWFNIFEIWGPTGGLKGWYCNVTKPARLEGMVIISEDLELDLFVSPGRELLTLDEDEFEARDFGPSVRAAALNGLEELKRRVREGISPFNSTDTLLSLKNAD